MVDANRTHAHTFTIGRKVHHLVGALNSDAVMKKHNISKFKSLVKWTSLIFCPVGFAITFVIARLGLTVVRDQQGWVAVGLAAVLVCFGIVAIYAFFFTPWRL